MFHNRTDAGKQLAQTLAQRRLADNPPLLVLGIPRGGVVVASEIAKTLRSPLDIVVTKKIGAPGNPEYAIGAINLDGETIWNEDEASHFRLTAERQTQLISKTLAATFKKDKQLRQGRAPLPMIGRTVILVDDGIATGYTTRAAIAYVRTRQPRRILLAVPVGPKGTLFKLRSIVDELICLETPRDFTAVGNYYQDFSQVEDREVREILTRAIMATADIAQI